MQLVSDSRTVGSARIGRSRGIDGSGAVGRGVDRSRAVGRGVDRSRGIGRGVDRSRGIGGRSDANATAVTGAHERRGPVDHQSPVHGSLHLRGRPE
jgi:hypothetical protein